MDNNLSKKHIVRFLMVLFSIPILNILFFSKITISYWQGPGFNTYKIINQTQSPKVELFLEVENKYSGILRHFVYETSIPIGVLTIYTQDNETLLKGESLKFVINKLLIKYDNGKENAIFTSKQPLEQRIFLTTNDNDKNRFIITQQNYDKNLPIKEVIVDGYISDQQTPFNIHGSFYNYNNGKYNGIAISIGDFSYRYRW